MTAFAIKVYKVVLSIPIGETRTYKWVAKKCGRPKAQPPLRQILKNNPCPIIIPCHRVVNNNHKLGGYIFGPRLKKKILDLERKIKQMVV